MQTMLPTLRNGRNIWDRIHMPRGEFEGRIETLRRTMAEQNLDVLLAYGHAFDHYGNPCYLSNYMIRLPRGFLVALTADDVALFFEGPSRGLPSAKKLTWVDDVRPCPDTSQECVKYLEEKALAKSTIGLAGIDEWMPQDQRRFLGKSLKGAAFVDAGSMLQKKRMIKSDREMDQMRRASRIVGTVFERREGQPVSGLSERVIEAGIIRDARLEGAEDVRVLFGRPAGKGWALHPAGDDTLGNSGTLIIALALVYERYWAEAVRTCRIDEDGLALPELKGVKALYTDLTACLEAGKALSRCAGDIMARLDAADEEVILDYGLGQGIGLSLREWPLLDKEASGGLEQGMCLTLRLCMKDKALGGGMIGNTLAVTEKGLEVLTA